MLARGDQRRVLVIVMVINIAMFVAEFTAGVIGQSSALMADLVDMLGDAFVYAADQRTGYHSTLGSGLSMGRNALMETRARSARRLHQGSHDRPAGL